MKQLTNTVEDFLIGKTIVSTGSGTHPFLGGGKIISFIFSDKTFMLLHIHNGDLMMLSIVLEFDIKKATINHMNECKRNLTDAAIIFYKKAYANFLISLKLISDKELIEIENEEKKLEIENEKVVAKRTPRKV